MDKIEDLKETAPCGMLIHYTVDRTTDFVTYNDIKTMPDCSEFGSIGVEPRNGGIVRTW